MKATILTDLLESCPRIAALLRAPGTEYLGPCVVQDPGAWTRLGPTWRVAGDRYICIGPGVNVWGTTQGLAELATADTAKPKFHAIGISISPRPNIIFAMTPEAITNCKIEAMAEEAQAWAQ